MLGLLGILLSLGLLMYLAYRGHNVIILAPVLAMLAVLVSGEGAVLLGTYTQIFMQGMGGYVIRFFPLFLLGALFGKLMDDSGSARSISYWLVGLLGAKQAIVAIVLACGILTYGGVSLFVVSFAVYPIAAALFRDTRTPKRLIPGAICLGSVTFTMTAFPGTPAIQNVIPMPYFHTDTFAAPGLGIIAGLIMMSGGILWLKYRVRRAAAADEGYGKHVLNEPSAVEDRSRDPSIWLALFPIVVVISSNFILSKWVLPNVDNSYLQLEKFGAVSLSTVIGSWAIIVALALACLALMLINLKRWVDLKETVNKGALGSLLPIFNTASEVGYGSVIASLAGFMVLQTFMLDLSPNNILISEAIVINVLAGITGSASGGLSIALNTMGATYLELSQQLGVSPELMHKVASMASGGLDSLPHNGAVISTLAICGLTHKQSYVDIFMVALVVPMLALVVVITLGTTFGSF